MNDHSLQSSARTEDFLRLLDQHESSLRAYILGMVINWNDAQDLAQETRMRLWQQFANFDPSKDFGAWARAIAYYVVLAHRKAKSRQKRQFSEQFLAVMRREMDVLNQSENARRNALACCLKKLTDYQRRLMADCYAAGATVKHVAVQMGRSVRGLQQTVARIRALLHDCVEGVLEAEEHDG